MRSIRFIFAALFITSFLAVAAAAQTADGPRLGLIDTRFFAGKDGITKYIAAVNALDKEFAADENALKTMATKLQTLEKEITTLREQASKPNSPIKPETIDAKVEEFEKLAREYKFKQEDAQARYQRREQAVMNPIRQDIGKALQEYAAQKGYSLILDIAKLAEANIVLAVDEKILVTQDFIKFYNSRPATAATTAAK
jgi:Skp family chaperone for outer membrane proteins